MGHLRLKLLILVPRLSSLYHFLNEICPHLGRECLPKNMYFLWSFLKIGHPFVIN